MAAVVAGLLGAPTSIVAQSWALDTEMTLASRYEWRGLVRDPGANLQQALYLSGSRGSAIVTAGLWWATDLSDGDGGLPRGWGSERSPWVEASYGSDAAFAFLGASAYDVDGPMGASLSPDTWEAYAGASAMLPRVPLQMEGTLFWDVHRVRGGYLETAAALQIPLWTGLLVPVGSLFLEAQMGTSLGQERADEDAGSAYYFENRGVGHVDVSLRTTTTRVAFLGLEGSLTLEARWTRGFDPATRRGGSGLAAIDRDRWTWRAGVHLSAPACRPDRELCEDL